MTASAPLLVIVVTPSAEDSDRLISGARGAAARLSMSSTRYMVTRSSLELLRVLDDALPDLVILSTLLDIRLKNDILDAIRSTGEGATVAILDLLTRDQHHQMVMDRLAPRKTGPLMFREPGEALADERNRPDELLVEPFHPAELHVKLANLLRLRELRVRQRQLDKRQRQLFEMLIHDMGNAVTAVMAALSFYKEVPPASEYAEQAVDDAFISSYLLQAILNDTLDVLRVDSLQRPITLHRKPIDILLLVQSSMRALQAQAAEKRVTLHLEDYGMADQTLVADPVALQRVLYNLLNNALKFSPMDGHIYLSVGQDAQDDYQICVEDEGDGFSAEMLAALFDPAKLVQQHQAHHERAGRGLGLLYCRLVMTGHGGTLEASNRLGGGARLRAILPIIRQG